MLKTWEARRLETVLQNGKTKPLVIECVRSSIFENGDTDLDPSKVKKLFVVKSTGNPEIHEASLFCELFGNILARDLGINTPEPVLVNLSPEFIQSLTLVSLPSGLRLRPGLAAGCEFIPRLTQVVPGSFLNDDELSQAFRILAFDLLTQNPDRTREKADGVGNGNVNCASRSGKLLAFDFELCFSFLYALSFGKNPKPWQVSKLPFARSHVFRIPLQDRTLDPEDFLSRLKGLSVARLTELSSSIPESWCSRFPEVCSHISQVAKNTPQFEIELRRCLK
jgi:hypothetical protein